MSDLAVVHPLTGEIFEHLDQQPPETLADALYAIRERHAAFKAADDAIASELRRRLKLRQTKIATFGDWEVEASVTRSRAWDAAELEHALEELVNQGVLRAADTAGVVTREPQVAGKLALAVRGRLTGDARAAVDDTWEWKERPGPVTVTRSVQLLDAATQLPQPADLDPEELFA